MASALSIRNNYLTGIQAGAWWRLLRENDFSVDPAYWPRAACISLLSLGNSLLAWREKRLWNARIQSTPAPEDPVFILGHWRSGTTWLHYLLAADTERFAAPNTYQAVNPGAFLSTEDSLAPHLNWIVPPKRPMDNLGQSLTTPQEDEFAPCLESLRSPYLALSFPRRMAHYERYLTFEGVPDEEVRAWVDALTQFLRKVTLRNGRTCLLKSPSHTARIRLLRERFPHARFLFLHRHPHDVFRSTRHFFDSMLGFTCLQRPDPATLTDGILRRYRILHKAYLAQRDTLPKDQLLELSFDDLERQPLNCLQRIYTHLGWEGFANARPKFEAMIAAHRDYQRNRFEPLHPDLRTRLEHEWGFAFREWNYQP